MSKPRKIPARLKDEFMGFMAANDHDDLPDGAWFCCLEQAAEQFIEDHNLKGCNENDLAHDYIRQADAMINYEQSEKS